MSSSLMLRGQGTKEDEQHKEGKPIRGSREENAFMRSKIWIKNSVHDCFLLYVDNAYVVINDFIPPTPGAVWLGATWEKNLEKSNPNFKVPT